MRGRGKASALCGLLAIGALLGLQAADAPAQVPKANLLPGGRAIAPPSAPASVKAMIEAANPQPPPPLQLGRRPPALELARL
jgi:hypothetical protein